MLDIIFFCFLQITWFLFFVNKIFSKMLEIPSTTPLTFVSPVHMDIVSLITFKRKLPSHFDAYVTPCLSSAVSTLSQRIFAIKMNKQPTLTNDMSTLYFATIMITVNHSYHLKRPRIHSLLFPLRISNLKQLFTKIHIVVYKQVTIFQISKVLIYYILYIYINISNLHSN